MYVRIHLNTNYNFILNLGNLSSDNNPTKKSRTSIFDVSGNLSYYGGKL